MLVLSALHKLLSQILSLPDLHTAVLLTPEGQLVSAASDPSRPKDDIRVVVGLCGEVWQETQEQGHGMIDSEVGRILVLSIEEPRDEQTPRPDDYRPLMLLALNSTNSIEWEELEAKGKVLAGHLSQRLSRFLATPKSSPASPPSERAAR